MKNKLATFGTTSNKRAITDGEFQDGFEYNSILESSYLNGQINRVDEQVYIITQELVHVLEDSGITLDPADNYQLAGLIANKNLSNLTSTGKNIANWSSNVSNCITEIPQDIKLELNNGTLTLKAGSKVYVPNGAGVFDAVTIDDDIIVSSPYINGYIFLYYYDGGVQQANSSAQQSGSSYTMVSGYWFDTNNNSIKRISSGSVAFSGLSFPLGIVYASGNSWTNIDQVFNGFGYIGSSEFLLPNVEVLIPNGRNADGTLKNIIKKIQNVSVITQSGTYKRNLFVSSNGALYATVNPYEYKESENLNYISGSVVSYAEVGVVDMVDDKVTSLSVKAPFHAVDYNDLQELNESVVHKTGNETISGLKTFFSLRTLSNLIDASVTPQTNQYSNYYENLDKNGARLTSIFTSRYTNGENVLGIQAWDGNQNYSITIGSNGTTSAPTPAVNDSSTKIATTSFVKTYLQYVNVLPVNPDSNVFYAIPE